MTLVEFLVPIAKGTHQDRVLAVLYFRESYEEVTTLKADDIRQSLKSARISGWNKINVADVLNKSGALVDYSVVGGRKRLWSLTDLGRKHVRDRLCLPETDVEIENDVGTLETLTETLPEDDVREYVNEALKCLKVGALRACVVFLWSGVIRTLQKKILSHGNTAANASIQKHDPKSRAIKSIDDFAHIKDSISLLAAKELGIIDKNQKDALTECLNLRNRSGHPGRYKPGVKKVSAYVEDVTSIVFK